MSELCGIVQLPQSTVSRHLKALADSGWVAARAEGTSNLYTMTRDDLDPSARRLWLLVREQVGSSPAAAQDQRRLQAALAERRTKSQEFFSSSAGQWDRVRDDLFGDRFHLAALAALADATWTVGDLGCGTGQVSAALAPFVARVIAVDASAAMLQAAKKRLQRLRQRRPPPRRARGAADRRRAAGCGDADARAAPRAGAGARARRGRARPQAAAAARSSSTCCRTIARATASRWATCGSGSATSTCVACSRKPGSKTIRIVALPPDAARRVRDYSSQQGGGPKARLYGRSRGPSGPR